MFIKDFFSFKKEHKKVETKDKQSINTSIYIICFNPKIKKKSAHYILEKKKSLGNQKYVYFRVILPMLILDKIRYEESKL